MREKLKNDLATLLDKEYGYLNAGFPRFMRLFGRDSLISSWQLLEINQEIAKASLEILSQTQGKVINDEREEEPGKILHETDLEKNWHPAGFFPFPYYGSIDSTPWFLIVFALYYKKTKDRKFLKNHWENILMALNWMEECGDKDKDYFLEYQRKNPKGLFHQGWKDDFKDHLKIKPPVAIVEVQGYQYLALKEIAKLAEERKKFDLVEKLKKRAKFLKEKFNEKFWMEDEKYFALALDGKKNQRKSITSNPGHLLFCEILEKEKQEAVVKKLFSPELWTRYGIRTHGLNEPDFDAESYHLGSVWPHDNWIIAQGLKKCGYSAEYQKVKNAILTADKKLGNIPELYAVTTDGELKGIPIACIIQSWASGAALQFLTKENHEKT